jgi:glycosyltransferase involved in cell wall biosynthesis
LKFSVIIPTYNRSKELSEALGSLVNQKFTDFETIVCDDGSIDDTKKIVESYRNRLNIVYYYEDNWGGPARPRNNGLKIAKGEWICFLDSDDQWYSDKLERIANLLDKYDIDLVCHLFITSLDKRVGTYRKSPFFTFYEDLLINGNRIVNSSICVRRNLIPEISEDRNLIGVEDYNLLLDIAKKTTKVYCLNVVLGSYLIHENNISGDFLKQIDKIEYMLSKQDHENKYLKQRTGLVNYLRASFYYLDNKELARKMLLKCIKSGSYVIRLKSVVKLLFKL